MSEERLPWMVELHTGYGAMAHRLFFCSEEAARGVYADVTCAMERRDERANDTPVSLRLIDATGELTLRTIDIASARLLNAARLDEENLARAKRAQQELRPDETSVAEDQRG